MGELIGRRFGRMRSCRQVDELPDDRTSSPSIWTDIQVASLGVAHAISTNVQKTV